MKADAQRVIGRFRFGPILAATVLTVIGIWLFKTVAQVFVLLMLGILLSLYLGAVSEWIQRRTRAPEGVALAAAISGSLGVLAVWDAGREELTFYSGQQTAHVTRTTGSVI